MSSGQATTTAVETATLTTTLGLYKRLVTYESQEQLDSALAYWQKVLRLQDWRITAKIARASEMGEISRLGQITQWTHDKIAKVKLLDPSDHNDGDFDLDHEETLVHELVHIHSNPLRYAESGEEKSDADEVLVNMLADALVRLNRRS